MRNRSPSRLAGCLALTCLFCGPRLVAQFRPVPDLKIIRAAYIDSLTSIRSSRIDYEITWPRTLPGLTNNPEAQKMFSFETVTDGNRKAVLITRTWHNGFTSQSRAVFDGRQYSQWVGPTKESPHATGHVNPPRHPGDFTNSPTVFTLMGDPPRAQWTFTKQLSKEGIKVLGWEFIDEFECIKVEFPEMPEFENYATPIIQTTAWFDPAHGYLPRKFILRRSADDAPEAIAPGHFTYAVDKFQQHSDSGGRQLWAPASATVDTNVQTQRIVVTQCQLNQPVTDADFLPDFPENSVVTEYGEGGSRRTYTVVGAAKVPWKPKIPPPVARQNKAKAGAPVLDSSSLKPLSARPSDSLQRYWGIALGLGLGAVALGYLFRRRYLTM